MSMSCWHCRDARSPQALVDQKATARTPTSAAARRTGSMSETTHVDGAPEADRSSSSFFRCGTKASSDASRLTMTCGESSSSSPQGGGRPSGMEAKPKPGAPASAAGPRVRSRRRRLRSEWTKVTRTPPRTWRSFDQVQCRRDVALRREWEEHRVGGWLLSSSRHGRGSVSSCGAKVRFLLLLQCCLLCRPLLPY